MGNKTINMHMPVDFTHLDKMLLEAIELKHCTFTELRSRFESEFDKLSAKDRLGAETGWRLIDRRLQALRKQGKIRAEKRGWVRVSQEGE